MILLFGCTFWSVLFLVNAMENLLAFDNLHNETCVKDTNCPSEMFCKKDINLCVCNDDFIFSNQLAMCEQSKKFENFSIAGPSIINLNEKEVYFNLLFEDYISRNWTYQWNILNGSENANFTGLNTQMLKMIILKPGFVSLSITIKNLTSRGYKQHNLTIYDQNLFPIIKIENLNFILPLNYVVLNAENSSNAKYFKWILDDDLPAKMVVGSPLNESKLFLNNLVPGTFLFNLSVWNDYSPFNDTKIVEINVFKGSSEENLIEMVSSLNNFTFKNSAKLLKEIEKILEFQTENKVLVKFTKMTSKTSFFGNELILFYFYASKLSKNKEILDAEQIASSLQNNLTFQKSFGIVQIVPYYCKSCSGHGKCDKLAKNCVCDDFWMPNIFVKMTNNGRNLDCSWPSIVVWTSLFFILYLLAKLLVLYWKKDEEERLDKSKLLEDLLRNYKQPSKQIGKFSPVKTVKRRRGKDCLNKFKKRFLEYSAKNTNQINSSTLKEEREEEDDSIILEESSDSSLSD